MKPSLIKESLQRLISIKQPTFIWGQPGVGKSQIVKQIADEYFADSCGFISEGYNLRDKKTGQFTNKRPYLQDVRAVLLDPVDLRGIPRINGDGTAHWCPPDFLPKDGQGILFLDELPAAPPLVQASCYQLVLDRCVGEYHLPDGWSIIAAGNYETDRAVTHRMPSPLANRFTHLHFEVDLEDWVNWALSADIRTEVIAFIRFRPNLLHSFDPSKNEKSFPTPRSWEFISNIINTNLSTSIEYEVIKGTVGEGAAAEFVGFLRIFRQLPNPDLILLNPQSGDIPTDPATLYALTGALAARASQQTMERLCTYANRLPDEFSVLLIRDCVNKDKSAVNSRAFIEWASKHSDVLI